jgi:hypothetical protein
MRIARRRCALRTLCGLLNIDPVRIKLLVAVQDIRVAYTVTMR